MTRKTMSVKVREHTFTSARECANFFGVSTSHVYVTLCRGNIETLGFGKGYKPPGNPNYGHPRSKKITLGKTTFPSIAEASEAIGWSRKRLAKVLRQKGPIQSARLYAAVLAYDASIIPNRKEPK